MSDLISRSTLLDKLNDGNIQTTLNLPIEEVLGEDVDIDDFVMLLQDAIHIYREMVIKVISDQPTAYDVEKVVEQLLARHIMGLSIDKAVEIVKDGGINGDDKWYLK